MITNPQEGHEGKETERENGEKEVGEAKWEEARLDGSVVKLVWTASRLERRKLKEIW